MDFTAAIAALWRRLELGPPPAGDEAALRVDGREIRLRPSPDGRGLRLSIALGRLPEGRAAEPAVEALLRRGLGLLHTNAACIALEGAEREVTVSRHVDAAAPAAVFDAAVDALLAAAELVADAVPRTARRPGAPAAEPDPDDGAGMLILRP